MSLNSTPNSDRIHIGIFGRRNAGKSSIINAITGQELAIVSDIEGTTTDPVSKAMELLPLGPVVIIDTPGVDDRGVLGDMRIKKTYQVLNKTDIALLVVDSCVGMTEYDFAILEKIREKKIPCLTVFNKSDISGMSVNTENEISVSTVTGENIHELKERIARIVPQNIMEYPIIADKVKSGDCVVMVVPIDKAAPKGRIILPQQNTLRELLDSGCTAVVCRDSELEHTLDTMSKPPKFVITDSQVFGKVSKIVPENICLTSFSILFARHKGNIFELVKGVKKLDTLSDNDIVLISEGCTHHRQCGDIGTVKLPAWIKKYTGRDIKFEFTSGTEFPAELSKYSMIIHCGGCMLNEREMKYRIKCAADAEVPITNYGMTIAYVNGILRKSLEIFPEIENILKS